MDEREDVTRDIKREFIPGAGTKETEEEIEREISHTRAEMTETVEAIQDKLSPGHLKEQVREKVRGATVGRARKMMKEAGQKTRVAGSTVLDVIKNNPVPMAMLGVGTAWLIVRGIRGNGYGYRRRKYRAETAPSAEEMKGKTEELAGTAKRKAEEISGKVQEKTGQVVTRAREKAGEFGEAARERTQRAASWLRDMMESSPFAVGAAAFALGAAIGFSIPEARKEKELMGEALEKTKETASQAIEKAKMATEKAVGTAAETVQEEITK